MRQRFSNTVMLTAGLLLAALQARADLYVGGGATLFDYRQAGYSDELSLPAVSLKLGGQFSDFLAAEIRAGVGVDDDDAIYLGYNNDVKLDAVYGIYLKGGIPVSDSVYPYLILGWTELEIVSTVYGYGQTLNGRDTSYGVGLDLYIADGVGLNLEYVNYYDKSSADVTGLSLGILVRF